MISCDIFIKPAILLGLLVGLVLVLPVTAEAVTVKEVYAGGSSSYAVDAEGNVWVWGSFFKEKYMHPTKLSFIDHVRMIAPGTAGCAVVLKDDGTVWAWGNLPANCPGAYPGQNSTTPVQIPISDVRFISCTGSGTSVYMIKEDGSLWMCGSELCLSMDDLLHTDHFYYPVQLPVSNISKVVVTQSFVYAQKDDGSWWGWGENRDYQLNDGTDVCRDSPVRMQLANVKEVSTQSRCFGVNDEFVSASSVLALDRGGQVYGWGDNTYWVAGDSSFPTGSIVSSPNPVPGMSNVLEIGSGVDYSAALKRDGTVWAWGSNPYCYDGQTSLDSNTPVKLAGFTDIVSITTGNQHMLGVRKDGTVWAWGSNMGGELGNGEISERGGKSYAVQVTDLYVDFSGGTDVSQATSTPAPVHTYSAIPDVEDNSTETSTPAVVTTVSPTPVPLPSVTPESTPGFGFTNMVMLGCLFVTVGMLSGFVRRKDR